MLSIDKRPRKTPLKPFHVWEPLAKDQATILEGMLPYLIIKRQRAELFRELRSTCGYRGGRVVPEDLLEKRQALCNEISKLNM